MDCPDIKSLAPGDIEDDKQTWPGPDQWPGGAGWVRRGNLYTPG